MFKKSTVILFFTVTLVLLAGCQSLPGFNIFSSGQETDAAKPRSNFVDARQSIQVGVDEPLAIASYHRGHDKLAALQISINGQPLRSEATAGQPNTFPENLATAQALVWGQPTLAALANLDFPAATCENLASAGGPVQSHVLLLTPPSSVWTVCHVWVGHISGSYDLSIVAVDEAQRSGDPIVQRIEVR
jgi:hypothetical protein